jgi:uncharacterized protein YjbI with pentapeptide repeats
MVAGVLEMPSVMRLCWTLRLPALALILLAATPFTAEGGCSDRPGPGVDWTKCQKMRLVLRGEDLSGGHLERTNLSSSDLMEATLVGASLAESNLERTRLQEADLQGANLSKVQGSRANLKEANLAGANFTKAEMPRANMASANLARADLSKTELGRAVLSKANLAGASLRYANIARADLTEANLEGVDFTGSYTFLTRVEGTDLSQTMGLTQNQLDLACGDTGTKLPAGLEMPAEWPCANGE